MCVVVYRLPCTYMCINTVAGQMEIFLYTRYPQKTNNKRKI